MYGIKYLNFLANIPENVYDYSNEFWKGKNI